MVLVILVITLSTNLVSASLGTYAQYSCVDIKTILNTTAVNISTLSWPNSTVILTNGEMTKSGYTFNYTFCDTKVAGTYIYDYVDASGNVYVNSFDATPTGDTTSNTFFIIMILFAFALLITAFIFKNNVFAFISGCVFLVAGVYTMIYGFGDITSLYTRLVSFVVIGLGMLLSITSALDAVNDNYGNDAGVEEE